MPLWAVTLEPLVQGERDAATLRLLGEPSMLTNHRTSHPYWYKISAQGTRPLANISENFLLTVESIIR